MRIAAALEQLSTVLVACACTTPAIAATRSYSFDVRATVVAACAIPLESLLRWGAMGQPVRSPCQPAPTLSHIPAPQPVVIVKPDSVTGRTVLTIEF